MTSFFLTDAQTLAQGASVISLHAVLDWQAIRAQFTGLYRREFSQAGGPIPYDALGMFKLMLLGQWHGLSDAQLEQALRVRIDLMVFTGFEPSAGELPDASTICRFRNRLAKANAHQRLLKEVNRQLEHAGLTVSGSQGAIIGATIIPSAARHNTEVEVNGDDPQGASNVSLCADDEAR